MTPSASHPSNALPESTAIDWASHLNELLEAERAGARVARETLAACPTPELQPLLADILRDEVHWCQILRQCLLHLGHTPGTNTGDFYQRAMAIEALPERLQFLNRGQGWVARKLRELLPHAQDPALQQHLADMLAAHQTNLERVNLALPTRSSGA